MSFTVAGIVRDQAAARGESVAIVFGDRRISYGELDERSNRVARALLGSGVRAQDHVAFVDMNGPEYFEVLFGCAKVNAINVGVNWRLAPGEMASTINDAEALGLFVGPEFRAAIGQVRGDLHSVRTVVNLGEEYEAWLAGRRVRPARGGGW